ncbi:RNA 2',3'-cyclic phosphodiesterase [Nocardioides sp. J2M5]|uniref:RNA 2',3'-cyclic phosphodiesterase n=1 Tax=Nocardioides palaemonis TaxID=2829810 RepID=UPI001BA996D3|nr:RNA 2',3'-cyclic phosphodiesterase [Nocardioides palaemonis]MBS2940030.1 RNA 2',3'-cyclic phosphodiesterase [Nocardioides palaemonis]
MRAFVAVVPPPDVVAHLDEFLEVRRAAADLRWSAAEQWHLTLAFAAVLPERSLDLLDELLRDAAARRPAFGARLGGGGAFPHPDDARVLFAGLAVEDDDALDRLAVACRAAMSRAGARVDGQRFRPHLTLARLGRPANVTSWVRLLDAYEGPRWQVGEVALVSSHLGEGPRRRPRHEVLATYTLG